MITNLFAWAVQSSIVVAVAALLPMLLRARVPHAEILFLQTVLFAVLVLPFLQPRIRPVVAPVSFVSTPSSNAQVIRPSKASASVPPTFERAVLWFLVAGAAARGVWLVAGLTSLHRYRRKATPIATEQVLPVQAQILLSADVTGPVTFGLMRPVVLVPPAFLVMPPVQQRAILCHELLHVRRHDWLCCIAEEAAVVLMWFHPAIWFLRRRIRNLREQVVDRQAVTLTGAREEYIEALLTMARSKPMLDVAAVPMFLRAKDLTNRVGELLNHQTISRRRTLCSYACVVTMTGVAVLFAASTFPMMGAPQQESGSQEVRGILERADVSRLPEPVRSQVSKRLKDWERTPFTTELMLRIKTEIGAMDRNIVQTWTQEAVGLYSVQFAYDTGFRRTEPVLVNIDTSRLPEPLRSQVEARVSTFRHAPFTELLLTRLQNVVTPLDKTIAYKWNNEPDGSLSLTFLHNAGEEWEPISGVLANIDVSRLPEPQRTEVDKRLARFRNAPFTNALMGAIGREVADLRPGLGMMWSNRGQPAFRLTLFIWRPPINSDTPE